MLALTAFLQVGVLSAQWDTPPSASASGDTNSADFGSILNDKTAVQVIDIYRDGDSCPEGTDPTAKYRATCTYGNYISNRPIRSDGKCCFHTTQFVFLQALPGGSHHLNAMYGLDSQKCCGPQEEDAELQSGKCRFESESLSVSTDYVTKCCWNPEIRDFSVHLTELKPLLSLPDFKEEGSAKTTGCSLTYTFNGKNPRVWGNKVEMDATIFFTCDGGGAQGQCQGTLSIDLSRGDVAAGRVEGSLKIQLLGPAIMADTYIDLSTKINDDNSVEIKGKLKAKLPLKEWSIADLKVTVADEGLKKAIGRSVLC